MTIQTQRAGLLDGTKRSEGVKSTDVLPLARRTSAWTLNRRLQRRARIIPRPRPVAAGRWIADRTATGRRPRGFPRRRFRRSGRRRSRPMPNPAVRRRGQRGPTLRCETHRRGRGTRPVRSNLLLGRRHDSVAATRQRREQEQWAGDVPSVATHSYTCMYGQTRDVSGVGRSPRASTASTREPRCALHVDVVRS